jgi:HAD superfamily hydrolase (TIGR01450 family)
VQASAAALAEVYDVAMLDLDGVVYVGADAVPAAPKALAAARARGMRLAFVTNNAARPPLSVAEHLTALGIPADPTEVITSAQTAAHYLARQLPPSANVLVIGTTGLVEALQEQGLTPVFSADDEPSAVVQGYSPELNWRQLAEGSIAILRGVPWVASNLDSTVPSPRGPLPGNGSMVAALRHATGVTPKATGKPDPTMHAETVERTGAARPIVVGDRLDTDIEGAVRVGCASLLVLSGVTTPSALIEAPAGRRPDFVGDDVAALLDQHPGVAVDGDVGRCGRWQVVATDGRLSLSAIVGADGGPAGRSERAGADRLDALRALTAVGWHRGIGSADVRADDDSSTQALAALDLG